MTVHPIEKVVNERLVGLPIRLIDLQLSVGQFEATFLINGTEHHCIKASYKKGRAISTATIIVDVVKEFAQDKGLI